MKDPYKNKDIRYNYQLNEYEGEDKDYENEHKVIFPKTASKGGSTI